MNQVVQYIAVSAIKPNPRNEEFFSDIEGEEFDRLVKSIEQDGILMPLRVAPDMTLISGHQRLRACKQLRIELVPVIIGDGLTEESDKVRQLIASNFGRMKNDPIKQAKWIKEYEALMGVRNGGDRKSERHNVAVISQEVIAEQLGIDVRSLQRIKQLNQIIPDLQDTISDGRITPTTGFKVLAKLTEEEQQQLFAELPAAEKFTQKQIERRIAEMRGEYDKELEKLKQENEELKQGEQDIDFNETIEYAELPDLISGIRSICGQIQKYENAVIDEDMMTIQECEFLYEKLKQIYETSNSFRERTFNVLQAKLDNEKSRRTELN